ncbi:hypothetical protein ANOM_006953 [Aspergillus nomiae NRRL 13137]|uniref:Uncharacterized protein n=1 Tax=Aspergillus nomiae NRRL (strain ATCC 15546 / NRRL 13137 / CBS 260.88 / M93) TaxID=1509407 RepID=A0A0L1IXD2_ASPN3|nr:uncharacterized protein ANOM_006953 [Aspergillus nomiae NRRL 13137]KNG84065.1 hypothetical protein ANOM_006953 [Aspergillus nomiae NRRL 13137]
MPYKIYFTTASETPVPPVFRLKRSWGAIKYADGGNENDAASPSVVGQPFFDEGTLHPAQRIEILEGYSSDISETDSVHSDDSADLEIREPGNEPPTYSVSHPWEVVDYHLYLCSVERGKDTHARRNGMFVYDGIDCRPVYYSELLEEHAFEPCTVGEEPQFLFWNLPIADLGPSFNGRHYVLGFDYNNRALFARHFEWMPNKTDDLWCVWDLGFTMYSITIPDLIILLESGLSEDVHVGMGILSSSPYCIAMGSCDDPGMELVITVLFCRWVLDFAEVIFEQDGNIMERFKARLTRYMEECRIILARASYRAWFVSQGDYTKATYQRNSSIGKFTSDLFTFSKSVEDGSLKTQSWCAPGLDTCNILRHQDRVQRRAETEQRLESLFTIPEVDAPPESPEEVLGGMVARSKGSLTALCPAKTPRTPPLSKYESIPFYRWSSMSPEAVKFEDEAYNGLEGTEYHKTPLSLLLKQILGLIETRPELDCLENRAHFGGLLSALGMGLQQRP